MEEMEIAEQRRVTGLYLGQIIAGWLAFLEPPGTKNTPTNNQNRTNSPTIMHSELSQVIPSAYEGKKPGPEVIRRYINHDSWPEPISTCGTFGTNTYRATYNRKEVEEAVSIISAILERASD
jgi:hypothetical protein